MTGPPGSLFGREMHRYPSGIAPLLYASWVALALIAGCSAKEEKPAPPPLGVTIAPVVQKDVPIRQEWVGTMVGNVDAEIVSYAGIWRGINVALSPSRARQIVRGTTQLGGGLSGVRPAVEHSV